MLTDNARGIDQRSLLVLPQAPSVVQRFAIEGSLALLTFPLHHAGGLLSGWGSTGEGTSLMYASLYCYAVTGAGAFARALSSYNFSWWLWIALPLPLAPCGAPRVSSFAVRSCRASAGLCVRLGVGLRCAVLFASLFRFRPCRACASAGVAWCRLVRRALLPCPARCARSIR